MVDGEHICSGNVLIHLAYNPSTGDFHLQIIGRQVHDRDNWISVDYFHNATPCQPTGMGSYKSRGINQLKVVLPVSHCVHKDSVNFLSFLS